MLTRRLDLCDDAACARAHEVRTAARSLDRPWHHPPTLAESVLEWRHDDPGERMEMWEAVRDDSGGSEGLVVGVATMWLTLDDNTDMAWVDVAVHPDHRRCGAGRALVERLMDRARAEGRTQVLSEVLVPAAAASGAGSAAAGSPYERFAAAMGFTITSTDLVRHLTLPVAPALLDELDEQARPRWVDAYGLETHVDGVPEARREGLCAIMNRLGVDAPTGDVTFEPESLTPARYADALRLLAEQGRHQLTTLALHRPTGAVVAYTDLVLPAEPSPVVWQWGTLVEAGHRGHRLGTAIKVANLRALAQDHPGRQVVVTSNDDTNRYMVDVNDALGFTVVERQPSLRRLLA